jgi:hypothetical protein
MEELVSLSFRHHERFKLTSEGEMTAKFPRTTHNRRTGPIPFPTDPPGRPDLIDGGFELTSTPTEIHHQFVKEVVDRTVSKRRRKQPHQAMTVKIPYVDYARVTRVREGWELNQTDLIRFFFELALPILEAPPQDLRPILEAHRDKVRSQRVIEAAKRGRLQ